MLYRQIFGLAGWLLVCFAAAGIGAIASVGAEPFYDELLRPAWAPPGWLFAPVWNLLYFLMGLAAWLVWSARGFAGAPVALSLFVVQLIVNASWSWLFFYWRLGAFAFMEVLLLCALVIATMIAFWRLHRFASLLLLPYLAWISFAAALTWWLWQHNPQVL